MAKTKTVVVEWDRVKIMLDNGVRTMIPELYNRKITLGLSQDPSSEGPFLIVRYKEEEQDAESRQTAKE